MVRGSVSNSFIPYFRDENEISCEVVFFITDNPGKHYDYCVYIFTMLIYYISVKAVCYRGLQHGYYRVSILYYGHAITVNQNITVYEN